MNKFKFYFIVFTASVLFFSCTKDDNATTVAPPRDYEAQYKTDLANIEYFLKNYYIEKIIDNPGKIDDQNITFAKIDDHQPSIMSYDINDFEGSTTYPKLCHRTASMNGVTYKLYYLVIRPGVGVSPCNVDGVLTAYKGDYLSVDETTNVLSVTNFEENLYPQTFFQLYTLDAIPLRGWSEILPKFKTGTDVKNGDGTVSHYDFGAGVMFLPSGYGYYNRSSSVIPAYSPLIFSFKLYSIERLDQDNDGVPSYLEDFNTEVKDGKKDGYMYDYSNTFNYPTAPANNIRYADDTDTDGTPDFLDIDDDGDNYTTKLESTKPTAKVGVVLENGVYVNYGPSKYYPFDAFKIEDDPKTPVDESLNSEPSGIAAFSATGAPDYTSPNRLRIHLDKDHHTAKP